jgi:aminopeptidase N
MVSVSNGILKDIQVNGGRKTYHWKTLYPIATYLVCLYSADYVTFSDKYISQDRQDTLPIQYYVFANQLEKGRIDFEDHPKFIDFFASTFGEYPFIKEKYGVAEFLWQLGAMEHQTITGIGSNFITGKKYFNDVYIHELAHHWWGDAVSPSDWKDIWLNEGFATYSEALYAEHIGGKKALQSVMLSKYKDDFKGTLYAPKDNLFGSTVYDKGCWVLHMLRKETGDSLFFQILRTYFATYKYKNASTDDFKKICELVTGKDFNKFFDQWVYSGIGKIELEYDWSVKRTSGGFNIKITTLQTQKGYDTYNFPLEFKFNIDSTTSVLKTFFIDKRQKDFEITLKDMPLDIELDPSNWLLADIKKKK